MIIVLSELFGDIILKYCAKTKEILAQFFCDFSCHQSKDSKTVYLGTNCEKTKKIADKELVSDEPNNMTVIGITAGVGGGLVIFFLSAIICVCRKVQQQKSLIERSVSSLSTNDSIKSHISTLDIFNHVHPPLTSNSY